MFFWPVLTVTELKVKFLKCFALPTVSYSDLQEDICFQGYIQHVSSSSSPGPLTTAEQQLHQIKITEVSKI